MKPTRNAPTARRVTLPTLRKRLSGWPANEQNPGGSVKLGRWGFGINLVAVVWGATMAVNLGWPRAAFFGPAWYQQYVAVFMIPAVIVVGAAYYWLRVRGHQHVLSEHQSGAPALMDSSAPGSENAQGAQGT
jgi:hypothetical protein